MNKQQRPERHDLSDQEYALLEPLLPPERPPKRGHPWSSHRQAINGILHILATGDPWRDLPERYGPFSTVHEHFRRWQQEGLWQRVVDTLLAQAHQLGRIDFDFGAIDGSNVRAHKAAAGAKKKGGRPNPQPRRKPAKAGLGSLPGRMGHQDPHPV